MLNNAIAMLAASGNGICNWVAEEIEWQIANPGSMQGVDYHPVPPEEDWMGASWRNPAGGYYRLTILYPGTFTSDGELAATLAHEVAGHQFTGSGEEGYAQYMESFCGES